MKTDFSCILCVADINITKALDECLSELKLPEVYIQRAKQMSLVDKTGLLGLRPATKLEESRALIYRIFIPSEFEKGIANRIIDATDMKMGGRGCILIQRIGHHRGTPFSYDLEKLKMLCGNKGKLRHEEHCLLSCIVPRGEANSLTRAILDMGLCVPVVFYGTGVGLRDKLGLMRITVPIEKEIIWFIIPHSEVQLVEKIIIPLARLDVPGRGFLYKFPVFAPVINLRIRHGKRVHAASMEQVITALDEVRGSSDWRRLGTKKTGLGDDKEKILHCKGLFFIGEDEEVETFRRTAIESGARGATLNQLELRSYAGLTQEQAMESHSRSLCDIIIPPAIEEVLMKNITKTELFDMGKTCVLKIFGVEMPIFPRHSGAYNSKKWFVQ